MGRRDFALSLAALGCHNGRRPNHRSLSGNDPLQERLWRRPRGNRNLVAIFILGPTGWQIEGYTAVSGAGF